MKDFRVVTIENPLPPIIVLNFKPLEVNVLDVKEFFGGLLEALQSKEECVALIINGSQADYFSLEARALIGKYFSDNRDILSKRIKGCAAVTGGFLSQLIFKSLILFMENDMRPTLFETMDEAMDFAKNMVANGIEDYMGSTT